MSQSKFITMGVINLTPNSFSDPHKHLVVESLIKTVDHLRSHQVEILDIGAESSAPMNREIGPEQEWQRLEQYFFNSPQLQRMLEFDLSLDSFRPETAGAFFKKLRELGHNRRQIWNDVSGVLDEQTFEVIAEYELEYVYCHNEVKTRQDLFKHASLRGEGDIFNRVLGDASRVVDLFTRRGLKDRLIFDPCFGFSKSSEENYALLKECARLVVSIDVTCLIGISRKSFLRSLVSAREELSTEQLNEQTDVLQAIFLADLVRELSSNAHRQELIVRLHDPACFALSKQSQIFLK